MTRVRRAGAGGHQVARVELPRRRGAGRVVRQALPVEDGAGRGVDHRQVELPGARPRERLPRESRAATGREQDERRRVGTLCGRDAAPPSARAALIASADPMLGDVEATRMACTGEPVTLTKRPSLVTFARRPLWNTVDAALGLRPRDVVHARDVHVVLSQAERLQVGVRQAEPGEVGADEPHGDGPRRPRAAGGQVAVEPAHHAERARYRIRLHNALGAQAGARARAGHAPSARWVRR